MGLISRLSSVIRDAVSLPSIIENRSGLATVRRDCVRPVRIVLPGYSSVRLFDEELVLEAGAGRQVDSDVPEIVTAGVVRPAESDGAAGVPVAEGRDRAGQVYCLAVGGCDDLIEGHGHCGRSGAGPAAGGSR
jgi:hypothetical protein